MFIILILSFYSNEIFTANQFQSKNQLLLKEPLVSRDETKEKSQLHIIDFDFGDDITLRISIN